MKKPSYNWRKVLSQMEPGVDYTYQKLASIIANTDSEGRPPDASQVRSLVFACGNYMEMDKLTGKYRLTDKGINFTSN